MSGKVAVMDNAGILVRLIDRSQVAADLSPNALWGAFAVDAERGFIGQVYRLTAGIFDRFRYFGKKDWRKYGRSLHDVDKYLESQQPAFVVRAGDALNSTLAGMSITSRMQKGGRAPIGGYGFINESGRAVPVDENNVPALPSGVVADPAITSDPLALKNPIQLGFDWSNSSNGYLEEGFKLTDGSYFIIPEDAKPTDPSYQDSRMLYFKDTDVEAAPWTTDVFYDVPNPLTKEAWDETTNQYSTTATNELRKSETVDEDLKDFIWMAINWKGEGDDKLFRLRPVEVNGNRVPVTGNDPVPNTKTVWNVTEAAVDVGGTFYEVGEEITLSNDVVIVIDSAPGGVVDSVSVKSSPDFDTEAEASGDGPYSADSGSGSGSGLTVILTAVSKELGATWAFPGVGVTDIPVKIPVNALYDEDFWDGSNNYRPTLRVILDETLSGWWATNPFKKNLKEPIKGWKFSNPNAVVTLNPAIAKDPFRGSKVRLDREYKWLVNRFSPGTEADPELFNGELGFVNEKCETAFLPEELFGTVIDQWKNFAWLTQETSGPDTVWKVNAVVDQSTKIDGVAIKTLPKAEAPEEPEEGEPVPSQVITFPLSERESFTVANTRDANDVLIRQTFTYVSLPKNMYQPIRWDGRLYDGRAGRRQDQIGQMSFSVSDEVLCDFFAKGEGAWGNNITITISQRPWREATAKDAADFGIKEGELIGWDRFQDSEKYEGTEIPKIIREKDDVTSDLVQGPDGPRIFSLSVWDGVNQAEFYPNVSFNPRDVDGSGVSIFIENVLANSNYIGCVVNNGEASVIDFDNVWILPRSIDSTRMDPITNPEGYVYEQSIKLIGGKAVNGLLFPVDVGATARSSRFEEALQHIFDNYVLYDAFLAFNAGQEISNGQFNMMIDDFGRVLGLTACPIGEAYDPNVPESTGGVTSRFVAKYNQWIFSPDSDSGQNIYTSPVGWVGKIIGQNSLAGFLPYAPAGYRRGIIQGALGLSRTWTAKQRLDVVNYQWNPIKHDPTGFILWDALTAQPIKSALSNIHVILSYQTMRRGIENTLKGFEFEFNDEATVNTILNLLRGMADGYIAQNYAEQIVVDAQDNQYGTDQIRIRWNVRFKEVARTIVVDVIAYPSSQDISVSMAG